MQMQFLPPLRPGILNGWLMLAVYFTGLILSVRSFPPAKRGKLFLEPHYPRGHPRWLILMIGRVCAIVFIALTLFTPLEFGTILSYVGLALYLAGFLVVMLALHDYKEASEDDVVTSGLYRHSRNPQWIGLVGVFLGTALVVGAWFLLILIAILVAAYHSQILLEEEICKSAYGNRYLEYMQGVPRYF
jgi:protein-S-isoprenylcysteine O-methyltransferase Ste14